MTGLAISDAQWAVDTVERGRVVPRSDGTVEVEDSACGRAIVTLPSQSCDVHPFVEGCRHVRAASIHADRVRAAAELGGRR